MKKVLSVILALVLVCSLAGVMGVSALADGEGVTIVVTGGTGDAIGGEGLSYAAAAALKGSYDDNAILVDAGGFAGSAAAIMTAAGYDLIVPDEALADWDITSISMGVSGLSAGVMFEKNGVKIAFVGVVPMDDQDADTYYSNIQAAVTAARDKGADYVIALGLVDDAAALTDNVAGIDIILTYGAEADVAEITDEAEEPAVLTTILTVGAGFDTIGVVTLDEDGVAAENLDAEQYEALDLEESDVIQALEAAFKVAKAEEEVEEEVIETAETAEVEETQAAEEASPVDAEQTEEAAVLEEEVQQDGESEEAGEAPENDGADESSENTGENDGNTEEDTEEPTEENTENAENTEQTEEQVEETAPVLPTPVVDEASALDAAAEEPVAEEVVTWDGAEESSATDYTRGATDLKIDFEHPVSKVEIKNGENWNEFLAEYYTLSNDNKTVSIKANILNDLVDGNYYFNFKFSDGAADESLTVSISGTYVAPAGESTETAGTTGTTESAQTTESTQTTESAQTTESTASVSGNTPATGDNSPILVYIIILAVLAVALVVVIVLVTRKGKKGGKH